MSAPSSDSIMPGVLIVIIMLPILYGIGRAGTALGDVWSAHLLEPQRSAGPLTNTTSATSRINAFSIAIPEQPGAADSRLQFHVTGLLGQGGRELGVGTADEALRRRLEEAGVIADVGAVSSPTLSSQRGAFLFDSARRRTIRLRVLPLAGVHSCLS